MMAFTTPLQVSIYTSKNVINAIHFPQVGLYSRVIRNIFVLNLCMTLLRHCPTSKPIAPHTLHIYTET